LRRWPSLDQVQRARPATLRSFFYARHSRNTKLIEQRLELIAQASPLTKDAGVIEPQVLQVKSLLDQITNLSRIIAQYDKRIAALVPKVDPEGIFASLPGAGPCFTPRLAVLFGQD